MKITNIECIPVQAPGRTLVPILMSTDEGMTGVGEAGLQRGWHAIAGLIEHLRKWMISHDPVRIEHLWQRMFRGGFYPGKIAAMAKTHLIKILPHNPLGPICTAASLHLDLACDNAGPQEVVFSPATMLPDVFECSFQLQGTRLTIPATPGIGVEFNREAARRYSADMTEPPHFHREDGSYTQY